MKRPRSAKLVHDEDPVAMAAFDGGTSATADGPTSVSSAPVRNARRLRSRRRSGRSSPRRLLAGSCVAVVAFASVMGTVFSLPAADAAVATGERGGAPATAKTDADAFRAGDGGVPNALFRERRIEESDASPDQDASSSSSSRPSEPSPEIEECAVPAGKCELCMYSDHRAEEVCRETGRWQKFECLLPDDSKSAGTEGEPSSDPAFKMKSCKHTDFDEGVAMLQFQSFCLLIGSLSLVSVRRQKRLSSSLFDRRKQHGPNAARSNPTAGSTKRAVGRIVEDYDEIEFTPMTNQERERAPLVERMEII
mmetsp:Transcript_27003/g.63393  ORF Transcript_27003/g.63393 Transcript_27003/m.63393 type:complete len:308 (+) Transcript_27003:213-1136(+)|eukprot:CAMPEP_0197181616 /NCGR_PEP_ID=MMETSP1423-20130617/5850_1 /TAXON_ID=476441 /ORGANISM="Pseudo-nitzschia heimii, Strain UNC1101" /LENGTH=307 /DNA_ID=CAMNT_0042631903 /DNA_START=188 /DNA_END=1111 /DNA_ORIENTATION=+